MKNLFLFITGNYKRSILIKCQKEVWDVYKKAGFTATGWKVKEALKKI